MRAIAAYDIAAMPDRRADALGYAVVGTALYEPILLALRRIALQEVATASLNTSRTRNRSRRSGGDVAVAEG